MPKRPPIRQSNSADAIFFRTLDGVPTPWFNTNWFDNMGQAVTVRVRLWIRRRGRTLHVETHRDSPSYPGRRLPVSNQRQGMHDLLMAGVALVRMSMRDPTSVPAHPRVLWDKSHPEFLNRQVLATTVCRKMPAFLNPKRGRPRLETPSIPSPPGHPVGMRLARRKEILTYAEKLLDLTEPMLDRVHDAKRMRGYEKHQRDEIQAIIGIIHRQTRLLRTMVFSDKFAVNAAPMDLSAEAVLGIKPADPSAAPTINSDSNEFTLDDVPMPALDPSANLAPQGFQIDLSKFDQ